ncbi:hypothetical protein [Tautonia plasticadhaerens]|uniref:Uncharacterized protein n=1 Tax=Tautonia plasticadhaerens TaxID=2527974 RepID=A0A518HAJ3_9BACT|nr:hypothetical protein [Tautonia plasticadhaerens]QDV37849.1 hypothetical protein ElP_57960 [Tautonia plasticadhaerens]
MSRLLRVARTRLVDEALALRVVQLLCFAAGPPVLILAARALTRYGASPAELVIGLLAACAVCLLCVILGVVLPLTRR